MIWIAIVLIIAAVAIVATSFSPQSGKTDNKKENAPSVFSEEKFLPLSLQQNKLHKTTKKIPVGIIVVSALWILNSLMTIAGALILLAADTTMRTSAGILLTIGIGWGVVGAGLVRGSSTSRIIVLVAAGIAIVLGIAVLIIPPITEEEHQRKQYEQYQRYRQHQEESGFIDTAPLVIIPESGRPQVKQVERQKIKTAINIIIALITIIYLMSPTAKRYCGIEEKNQIGLK